MPYIEAMASNSVPDDGMKTLEPVLYHPVSQAVPCYSPWSYVPWSREDSTMSCCRPSLPYGWSSTQAWVSPYWYSAPAWGYPPLAAGPGTTRDVNGVGQELTTDDVSHYGSSSV